MFERLLDILLDIHAYRGTGRNIALDAAGRDGYNRRIVALGSRSSIVTGIQRGRTVLETRHVERLPFTP